MWRRESGWAASGRREVEQVSDGRESIRALATVTLDARVLDALGPEAIDRLADLVEARLMLRKAAGEEPLLSTAAAAELVGVSADTVRRAIRSGAMEAAGYVGVRPRVRRSEVEAWVARGQRPSSSTSSMRPSRAGWRPRPWRRVLGDALDELGERAA
jgi:excisionase family DNA binding protein